MLIKFKLMKAPPIREVDKVTKKVTIKHLYSFSGEHGGTMMQVYSQEYPKGWEVFMNAQVNKIK